MNLKIGEIIRDLRQKNNITQEKLAEKLGTTPQNVSRWECEIGYPDIELCVQIADVFGVSLDVLFGRDAHEKEAKIQYYLNEFQRLKASGERQKYCALMSEAYEMFPLDYRIMLNYCWAKMDQPYDDYGNLIVSREESDAINESIVRICNRLLDECTDDELRYDAISALGVVYRTMEKTEEAIAAAKRLPHMWQNRELELLCAYDVKSDEYMTQLQEMTMYHVSHLAYICIRWSAINCDNREKIRLLQKSITVYELVYDDGNFGFYHHYVANLYKDMGDCYLRLNELDTAIGCYERFFTHAKAYDNLPDEHPYTAKLVDHLVNKKTDVWSGTSKNQVEYNLPLFEDEFYDAIRLNERFKALMNA